MVMELIKMLTIPNIKKATNLDLARTTLNCLEELVRRGNKELNEARQRVSFFHADILCLQSMANAMEAQEEELLERGDLGINE